MNEIQMSYIFIEKNEHESRTIKQIVLDILGEAVDKREDEKLYLLGQKISYRIVQKDGLKRCYLEMSSEEYNEENINVFTILDNAIAKSYLQKYFYCIKEYDGISAVYCEKLYPMFGEFERKLRKLVLLVLTKAYGAEWRSETISDEMLNMIKNIAQENVTFTTTLENMDLNMLETYLFQDREINYRDILEKQFSKERLDELSKENICSIIEDMRPTSLWKKHFEDFGTAISWQNRIKEIHKCRNKVAHHKTITKEEYSLVSEKINQIIIDLNNAINGINEKNFTEGNSLEIITDFVVMFEEKIVCYLESQSKQDMEKHMIESIQKYAEMLRKVKRNEIGET